MKDIDPEKLVIGDKSGIDLSDSRPALKAELAALEEKRDALPGTTDPVERARLELDIAETQLGLQQQEASWNTARRAFDACLQHAAWQEAVEACDILFRCEQDDSLAALGNGVWLSVTWPVPAPLTVTMLSHIIDETPDDSDGAAVAAMAAHYIAGLRSEGKDRENLTFFTNQLIANVAKRHRGIEDDPDMIRMWTEILGLNDVNELFAGLARILDTIVGDKWWYDRDEIRSRLPDQA